MAKISTKECSSCLCMDKNLQRCSRCKSTFYCSTKCQKSHYPIHKLTCKLPRTTNLLDIIRGFWEVILTPHPSKTKLVYYYGDLMLDGKRIVFGKEMSANENFIASAYLKNEKRSIETWYTTPLCLPKDGAAHYPLKSPPKPMTTLDFFQYWTAGKCTMLSICLSVLLKKILNRGDLLMYNGSPITCVEHLRCKVKNGPIEVVHCYEPLPLNPVDKPFEEWDCDMLVRSVGGHECIFISTGEGITKCDYLIDIAAAQDGIANNVDGFNDYPLYVERLKGNSRTNDEKPVRKPKTKLEHGFTVYNNEALLQKDTVVMDHLRSFKQEDESWVFSYGEIEQRGNPLDFWSIYQMDTENNASTTLCVIKEFMEETQAKLM